MTTATKKRTSTFGEKAKKELAPGQEISENGIIYRKRKDGFGTWRYDFTQSGVRHKGIIGSDRDGVTLSQARDVISEIRAKAITDRISGRTGRSTQSSRLFKDVAKEYLDWSETHHQDHRHNVSRMNNHLLPRFGDHRLGDVTTAMIETTRTELRRAKVSAQTIQRIVSLLSCTFDFAQKSDPNLDNPTTRLSRVKHQKKEVVPFTREETDALLQGLIRINQIAKEGAIRKSTKTYKPRVVPITGSLKPLLEDLKQHHIKAQRENGLLLSRNGVDPYNQIQVMFSRVRKQAGITLEKGHHVLRHTFATRASEKNIDLKTIQRWLGHATIGTTMIYVHSTEEHLEAAAKLLD